MSLTLEVFGNVDDWAHVLGGVWGGGGYANYVYGFLGVVASLMGVEVVV